MIIHRMITTCLRELKYVYRLTLTLTTLKQLTISICGLIIRVQKQGLIKPQIKILVSTTIPRRKLKNVMIVFFKQCTSSKLKKFSLLSELRIMTRVFLDLTKPATRNAPDVWTISSIATRSLRPSSPLHVILSPQSSPTVRAAPEVQCANLPSIIVIIIIMSTVFKEKD